MDFNALTCNSSSHISVDSGIPFNAFTMSKYTKLTIKDLMKVATIQAHFNQVATKCRLSAYILVDTVTLRICYNEEEKKSRYWHVVPACELDETIVEILQELTSNL